MTIPEGVPKGLYLYGTVGTGKSMVRPSSPLLPLVLSRATCMAAQETLTT